LKPRRALAEQAYGEFGDSNVLVAGMCARFGLAMAGCRINRHFFALLRTTSSALSSALSSQGAARASAISSQS
jgi:hypothetical protein